QSVSPTPSPSVVLPPHRRHLALHSFPTRRSSDLSYWIPSNPRSADVATNLASIQFTNGWIPAQANSLQTQHTYTRPTSKSANLIPAINKKLSFLEAAQTALAKELNSTIAVCMPHWRSKRMAMRPSWSTVTPRLSLLTTTPRIACTLSL